MEANKLKIFSGKSVIKAMGVKNALKEESIHFFEIDKTDSSYARLHGDIEIYVEESDIKRALEIIKSLN